MAMNHTLNSVSSLGRPPLQIPMMDIATPAPRLHSYLHTPVLQVKKTARAGTSMRPTQNDSFAQTLTPQKLPSFYSGPTPVMAKNIPRTCLPTPMSIKMPSSPRGQKKKMDAPRVSPELMRQPSGEELSQDSFLVRDLEKQRTSLNLQYAKRK